MKCSSLLTQEENIPLELQPWISTLNRFQPHFHSRLHKSQVNKILLKQRAEQQRKELSRGSLPGTRDVSGIRNDPKETSVLRPYKHSTLTAIPYPLPSKPGCSLESLAASLYLQSVPYTSLPLFQSRGEQCCGNTGVDQE